MIQQNATSSPTQSQAGGIQIVQQVVTANGEIQQIPVSLFAILYYLKEIQILIFADSTVATTIADDQDAVAKQYYSAFDHSNDANSNCPAAYTGKFWF